MKTAELKRLLIAVTRLTMAQKTELVAALGASVDTGRA